MQHMHLIAARSRQRQFQRIGYILGPHCRTQFPTDDVAGVIVEDGGQVIPAPAYDLEIGKVGLPQLVDRCGFILELAGGFHDDEGRAGNQVMCLQ
jgi:hypothetical protein